MFQFYLIIRLKDLLDIFILLNDFLICFRECVFFYNLALASSNDCANIKQKIEMAKEMIDFLLKNDGNN